MLEVYSVKVVITGASSPLGRALIDELLTHNIEVLAICRKNSERMKHIPENKKIKIVECSLSELSELSLEGKYDVFYHFAWASTAGNAARDLIEAHVDNIKYTLDAVDLAKRIGCYRFIGSGSQAEYGRVNVRLNAEVPTNPESAYGMAKLCAGQMSRLKCEQLGMEHIWTRILSVYGPYDSDKTLVMSVVKNLLSGNCVSCTKGEQIWDLIYSKDAARALYLLGEKGISGKIYCIGRGIQKTIKEYVEEIRDMINPEAENGFGDIEYSSKQVMYLLADIEELVKDTGFQIKYSFEKGIAEIVDFCVNEERRFN